MRTDSIHLYFPPQYCTLLEGGPFLSHHVPSFQKAVGPKSELVNVMEVSTRLLAVLTKAVVALWRQAAQ